jgi:hypothetical protein
MHVFPYLVNFLLVNNRYLVQEYFDVMPRLNLVVVATTVDIRIFSLPPFIILNCNVRRVKLCVSLEFRQ